MGVRADSREGKGNRRLSGPEEDILVRGLLHRGMLLFHIPSGWPIWLVSLALLPPLLINALIWWLASDRPVVALIATAVLIAAILVDSLVLMALPAFELSFGPWKAQLFALAGPRFAVAYIAALSLIIASETISLTFLIVVQTIGSVALLWGAVFEPFRLRLSHLEIYSQHMPPAARPLRLLHISDLHVERLTRRERKLLELVEEADPDLILITGDYLNLSYNRDPVAQEHVRELLRELSARLGVFAVMGSPPVDLRTEVPGLFKDLDIRLLVDDFELIDLGDGRRLTLLGLDCSHHIPTDAAALDALVAIAPNSMPRILLYHAPDLMPQASKHKLDLYLCGHTHGGQVRLPGLGAILTSSQYGKRYEMGLYSQGQTQMYVSRGVGMEGLSAPRVRFLAPPEITLITLRGPAA